MNTESNIKELSIEGAHLIKRIKSYFNFGFHNIQPYCYGNNRNTIELRDLLKASKVNFPFGFDLVRDQYVKSIDWDFSKYDYNRPVSSLAIHLLFGVYIQSRSVQLSVGRKKIKRNSEWTFYKSHEQFSLGILNKREDFDSSLDALDDKKLNAILDEAQSLIDLVCTVQYTDTPNPIEKVSQCYSFAEKILELFNNDLYIANVTSSVFSPNQLHFIAAYDQKIFKSPRLIRSTELDFFKPLIEKLKACGNFVTACVIHKLMKNIAIELLIAEKFNFSQEFYLIFEQEIEEQNTLLV
jgi:hypothetical protein